MDVVPTTLSVLAVIPALAKGTVTGLVALIAQFIGAAAWLSRLAWGGSTCLMASALSVCRIAVMPFHFIWAVTFVVLSPVFYAVAYALAPIWWLVSVVPRLEPLYIYFGTAIFVGIIAGVSAKLTADVFVSVLRLDREQEVGVRSGAAWGRPSQELVRRESSASSSTITGPAPASTTSGMKREDFLVGGLRDGSEIDWQVIDRIERSSHNEHMSKMPLLQSIILEEEEDGSSGGY